MTSSPNLDQMTPEQLRALAEQAMQLLSQVDAMGKKIHLIGTSNDCYRISGRQLDSRKVSWAYAYSRGDWAGFPPFTFV
ncbi:hypothetical protein QEM02_000524 [Pseudomonas putida]|nr:hypothetical protein [Pseudomonas putida]